MTHKAGDRFKRITDGVVVVVVEAHGAWFKVRRQTGGRSWWCELRMDRYEKIEQ